MSKLLPSLLLLLVTLSPDVFADEATPKLVYVVVEGRTITAANIKLSRFDQLDLSAQERIVEMRVGKAAAVIVTNQRFLGYGVNVGAWRDVRNLAKERLESIEVEDFSALVLTSDRFLSFNGFTGVWAEKRR